MLCAFTKRRLSAHFALAVVGGCFWLPLQVTAQTYPNKPVTVIVPVAPGGPIDVSTRMIAAEASKILGQQLVVENRPGASQKIGVQSLLRAPKDGYTFASIGPAALTINPLIDSDVGYDPQTDFTLLTSAIQSQAVLVVYPSVPVRSLQEFLAYARANPDKLTYGSGGSGSGLYFSTLGLLMKLGIKAVHVPYRSSGPALAGVLGGQVNFLMPDVGTAKKQVDSGKLIALAVTGDKRSQQFPGVPTMQEARIPELNDYTYMIWVGFIAAADIPQDAAAKLQTALLQALRAPKVGASFGAMGFEVVGSTPQEFAAQVRSELEYNRTVLESVTAKRQ